MFYRKRVTRQYIKQAREIIGRVYIPDNSNILIIDFLDLDDSSTNIDFNDPNDNSDIDLKEVSIVLSPRTLGQVLEKILERKSKRKRVDIYNTLEFRAVAYRIKRLASSSQKLPRVDDIRAIITDFQEYFASKLVLESIVKIIEKLAILIQAVVQNALSVEIKAEYTRK